VSSDNNTLPFGLPDPRPALDRLLATLSAQEAEAFSAKLALVRGRREKDLHVLLGGIDRTNALFIRRVWEALLPNAERAREEIVRAAIDTGVKDRDTLVAYVRDEFAHYMGSFAVSIGSSASGHSVGLAMRTVAELVARSHQIACSADALVKSMYWDERTDRHGNASGGHDDAPVIVVLTANKHETQAVFDCFKAAGETPTMESRGGTTYTVLGHQGGMRIVHVICEMGSGGVGAAAQRTQDSIRHWTPQAVVAVGIAWGIDEATQSIGDVLVATQVQGYDHSRLNPDGTLTLRDDRSHAGDRIISRLRTVDAHNEGDQLWPKLRFGLILSGQRLIDNVDFRGALKKLQPEAVGGEMEATGVYVSAHAAKVDWNVVKAICDWAHDKNSENKEERQKNAARNAAQVLMAALRGGSLYPLESPRRVASSVQIPHRQGSSTATNEMPAANDKGRPLQINGPAQINTNSPNSIQTNIFTERPADPNPPQVDARLAKSERTGDLVVVLVSRTLIPFRANYRIVTKNNRVVSGILLQAPEFFPTDGNREFLEKVDVNRSVVVNSFIELRVDYQSLDAPKLGNPQSLSGSVVRKYHIDDIGVRPLDPEEADGRY